MTERRLYPSQGLHGRVAHEIGRQVVSGQIAEGTLLPREAELAKTFDVSRQAVREALKVLAAKSLVQSRRRTGTYVLPRSSWNLLDPDVLAWHPVERLPQAFFSDLVELRRVIEPIAAQLAATRGTENTIGAIRAALEEMRSTIDDRPAFIRADVNFHSAVCTASGNVLFDRLGGVFSPLLLTSFALQGHVRTRDVVSSDTLPKHTAVYDAIAARDPMSARRAMESLVSSAEVEVSAIPWDQIAGSG